MFKKNPIKSTVVVIVVLGVLLGFLYNFMDSSNSYSLNQHNINSEISDPYIFLVAGHSYGGQKPRNTKPAYALTNNIQLMNHLKPSFMMHLGDIYQKPIEKDVKYIQNFNDNLLFPVFNAPGNHEHADINMYKKQFGDTYSSFIIENSLYLALDSQEYRKYQLQTEQHKLVIDKINEFKLSKKLKNLFIFSHHLIWAPSSKYFKDAIKLSNAPYHHVENFSEWGDIINSFDGLSKDKHVYFISGDVGIKSSIPYFYEEDPRGGRTYIATGLGDNENDSILVGVIDLDKVSFHILHLGHKNIKQYGMSYWKKRHPRLNSDKK